MGAVLKGAAEHNLQQVDVDDPIGGARLRAVGLPFALSRTPASLRPAVAKH